MTTAAEALVQRLDALGVEVVFGIPGVDNLAFFDALDRSSLRSILVRHEATAGFAADAWFRLTGRPAVCFTTAGPGAANALTPMGEAWASGSTFLHLTTAVASAYGPVLPPRGLPHYHPRQRDEFALLAKAARHCDQPNALADVAEDVLRVMSRPPFAAGYVEVPYDLLGATVTETSHSRAHADSAPSDDSESDDTFTEMIARASQVIAVAERPLIWAGSGAVSAAASVVALAERLDAPILLTHSAKRGFGHYDHPLVVAFPPHEPPVAELIGTSDVLLVLGSDLDAMMTKQFGLELPRRVVQVDIESAHIGMRYPVDVAVVAPVASAVAALASEEEVTTLGAQTHDGARRAAAARTSTLDDLATDGALVQAVRFLGALDAALPGDAVVVCDMAVAGYWAAGLMDLGPDRRLLYPIGWGTLGFGLPAAIGAAIASPGTRTIAVLGDAGASYALGELATIAQERLPITIVVVDDSGYGMLRYAAQQRFGRTFATDLPGPDFAAVAGAFSIPAWAGTFDGDSFPRLLSTAIDRDGPTLLHLRGALTPPRMALLGAPAQRPA